MPKKLCLLEKGVNLVIYLVTLIKIDNHIWQSWLPLVYFRKPKLFTWNVYVDQKKECQHSFPLVLTVGQSGLIGEVTFLGMSPPHTNISMARQ